MSYNIDHSIFDSSVNDVVLLSTRRDNKVLQSGRSVIQFEPAIVLDIVVDDSHPIFSANADNLGNVSSPFENPPDFNGKPLSKNDRDYCSIGMALIRLCYTHEKFEKESLIWAVPLDSTLISLPVLNEIVHVVKIFDRFYYTSKVNTKGNCNSNADFRYEQTYGKKEKNTSYSSVKLEGPLSRFDCYPDGNTTAFSGILGNYFWFNNKIRNLRRFEGDVILEGRFGQSIRMGAYDSNRKNDVGDYDNYKNGTEDSGGGNPMVLIRNRQRPISPLSKQSLHPLLPPVSGSISEKSSTGYISEDINNDGSSIHLTSGKTVSNFNTTCYKSYLSTNSPEEQSRFSPRGCTQFAFPELNRDQIVINSDRLLFSSRFGETIHFSKKRYMVVTDNEFTVDAQDQIVMTTNSKVVLNSPAIYLGEYDATGEPALLGQTTVDWLYDLCNWLIAHTHYHQHSHPNAGGNASPEQSQFSVQLKALYALRDKLHTLMSRRVFLTGGGHSPGSNGGRITDGVNPVTIDVSSGAGVPGGWKGKNRS
jgi:hypothetical protein